MSSMTRQDTLVGLAFPVIRVRYAGPDDSGGGRYIATLRHDAGIVRDFEYADSPSSQAYKAARECWEKYQERNPERFEGDDQERVFIPGDLSDDSYAFVVVPAAFLS